MLSLTIFVRLKLVKAMGVLTSVAQVGFSKSWRHENKKIQKIYMKEYISF